MSLEEAGFDLGAGEVSGVPETTAWAKGICACGHRVAKHVHGRCTGVPIGRSRLEADAELNECLCREVLPVMVVPDTRRYQVSWNAAFPDHPLNVALRRAETKGDGPVTWLLPTPLVCMNCGQVGGVRAAYWPGSRRMVSGLFCQGDRCAPLASTP